MSDLHVFSSISQQPTEGDGVCYSSQVNKQNCRQGLNVKRVGEVTDKERRFSFNVKYESSTKPETKTRPRWNKETPTMSFYLVIFDRAVHASEPFMYESSHTFTM